MTQQEFFERYIYSVRTDKIGGGTFGTVYKAYDNLLNRDVAIKVSEVKVINGKEFSLKDEFEAIKELPKHPNIANYEELYTFEFPQGVFDHAVMQFYQDGNLSAAIHGQMSQFQKEQVCIDLLQGIIHLHKHNVVHRDLKPGNILVVKRGDKIIPVITDFGLSKQVFQDGQSRFSNSFGGGTLKYSSPEQLRGEELRLNTDLWSYGVIVHQIFTGKDLFYAQNQSSGSADAEKEIFEQIVNKDISADLAKLSAKWEKVAWLCLERNPAIRVKSAEELLSILSGSASTPTPPKQPKPDEETQVFYKQQSGQNHSNDTTKIEEVKPETRNPKPEPSEASSRPTGVNSKHNQPETFSNSQPETKTTRNNSNEETKIEGVKPETRNPKPETTPPPQKKKNKILIPSLIFGVLLAVVLFVWQPWKTEKMIQEEVNDYEILQVILDSIVSLNNELVLYTFIDTVSNYEIKNLAEEKLENIISIKEKNGDIVWLQTDKGYFIDARDNNRYSVVKIGFQIWMAENLRYFISGSSWCYNDDPNNCEEFGRLYHFTSAQWASPDGWHVPSDDEWKILEINLGILDDKLDWTGYRGENIVDKLDNYGFNLKFGGFNGQCSPGPYFDLNRKAHFWTSTATDTYTAYGRAITNDSQMICRTISASNTGAGYSVRCLKD